MIDTSTLTRARLLLADQSGDPRHGSALKTLGAAALAASAAVLMAGVMVLGPGVALDDRRPVTVE